MHLRDRVVIAHLSELSVRLLVNDVAIISAAKLLEVVEGALLFILCKEPS